MFFKLSILIISLLKFFKISSIILKDSGRKFLTLIILLRILLIDSFKGKILFVKSLKVSLKILI